MALTVTNINSLSLLNILNRTSTAQSASLTRLSTGFRINRGGDDPAGLLALRGLETSLTATDAAIQNNQRTDAFLKVADGALGEVGKLLDQIQSLAAKAANPGALSAGEVASNQAQIDSAIAAIDRIIGTTEFNGKKLLDGTLAIDTDNVTSAVRDILVYSRNTKTGAVNLSVKREKAAELGSATVASGSSFSLAAATTIQVKGKLGTAVIDLASGSSLDQIRAKVNEFKGQTGVSAYIGGGSKLNLTSTDFGSRAFVSVNRLSGSTGIVTSAEDSGADAAVTINGQAAAVDGLNVSFNNNGLSLAFSISTSFNKDGGTTTFDVTTDGGATFQLGSDESTRSTIGIDGLYSQQLGASAVGYLSSLQSGQSAELLKDPGKAVQIVAEAKRQIAGVQGRLGGFQKFQVQSALNQQTAAKESLTSAISSIRDVDYAAETAELNRQNVLLQSSLQLLGIANQQAGQILALLR